MQKGPENTLHAPATLKIALNTGLDTATPQGTSPARAPGASSLPKASLTSAGVVVAVFERPIRKDLPRKASDARPSDSGLLWPFAKDSGSRTQNR